MSARSAVEVAPAAPRPLLVSVYLLVFMALLDINIVVVALPSMSAGLDLSEESSRWVAISYPLCVSSLALSAGAFADHYGRKRVFLGGVVMFTAGSGFCALASVSSVLIGGRFVQGIGSAIAVPVSLSLIAHGFTDPAARARAMGGWATVTGLAGAIGPVAGGMIVEQVGWRAVFAINLPLGALVILIAARGIAESAHPHQSPPSALSRREMSPGGKSRGVSRRRGGVGRGGIDLGGQVWVITSLGALSFGLIRAGQLGWTHPVTVSALAVALVAGAVCARAWSRMPVPTLAAADCHPRRIAVAGIAAAALGFSAMSLLVFLPAFLQHAHHHSPAVTGLLLLPLPIATSAGSGLGGRWAAHTGAGPSLVAGLGLISAALGGLMSLSVEDGYPRLLVVLVALGLGSGLTLTATNYAMLAAIETTRASTASALLLAIRQTGNSLGIAVLGTVLALRATAARAEPARCRAGSACRAVEAYTAGVHAVAGVAGTVALLAILVVLALSGWSCGLWVARHWTRSMIAHRGPATITKRSHRPR